MLELYKNIKRLRQEQGLSQEELAKKAGYRGKSMISKIESGNVDLSRSKIIQFAKIFGVSPGELLGNTIDIVPNDEDIEEHFERFRAYSGLIDAYLNAPEGIKQSVNILLNWKKEGD